MQSVWAASLDKRYVVVLTEKVHRYRPTVPLVFVQRQLGLDATELAAFMKQLHISAAAGTLNPCLSSFRNWAERPFFR
jgi:hypothetical protein